MHALTHTVLHPLRFALALALLAPCAVAARAEAPPPSYPAVQLLSADKTVVGETIRYPSGDARVTASIVTLAPGARTIAHRHGVPMFAYILDGELTVDYGDKGKRTYRAGDALMEAMAVVHAGLNTGPGPVRILAVYMGATGASDVIPAP
jgi:quercetin dioxygenase-like cupin family protein